jgi:DNA-binding transcriptional LysR family regulator
LKGRDKTRISPKAVSDNARVVAPGRTREPRRLSPHQLEAFSAIVSTGTITAAARLLNVSQPGVSRSLADLEREIGFPLFVRDKKRLFITPEGSAFYEELTRSYTGLDRLAKAAEEIRQLRRGHIRIAAMPALCFGPLPRAIKLFLADHPALKVSFEAQPSQRVVESVVGHYVDIGIAQVPSHYPGLTIRNSFRSDCVCVMPAGHPLAKRKVVGPADLANQAFVSLPPNSMAGLQLHHVMAEANLQLTPQVETLTSFAACAMVAEGLGVSVVDPFTAAAFASDRLLQRPFRPKINFGFRLIYPAHRAIARPAQALVEHLVQAIGGDGLVERS